MSRRTTELEWWGQQRQWKRSHEGMKREKNGGTVELMFKGERRGGARGTVHWRERQRGPNGAKQRRQRREQRATGKCCKGPGMGWNCGAWATVGGHGLAWGEENGPGPRRIVMFLNYSNLFKFDLN
jgi:hypothetical protein